MGFEIKCSELEYMVEFELDANWCRRGLQGQAPGTGVIKHKHACDCPTQPLRPAGVDNQAYIIIWLFNQ